MYRIITGSTTCPSGNKVLSSPGCAAGTTTHYVANSVFKFMIGGVVYTKAATAAGTAPTATTVPQGSLWGLFGFEIGIDGTIHAKDAAGNATGYASYDAALAALPTATAGHVLFMYVIVQSKVGAAWVGATDDFSGDCQSSSFINATVESGMDLSIGFVPSAIEVWNKNRNCYMVWDNTMAEGEGKTNHFSGMGLLSKPRCGIGTTPEACANNQFDFVLNNIVYTKAASAGGTTPTATTLPMGKYGLFGYEIGIDGTIDRKDAAGNGSGYNTADLALAALPTAAASHVLFMYFVVLAKPAANWVGATDDLVPGSDCISITYYDVTSSNPVTSYGITTLKSSSVEGFRIGYYSELIYPGDILNYRAWR